MTHFAKSIDDKILDNFYKQSADKIIQHLQTVREERKKNSRRWIWELIQNAKDVRNVFGKVSIIISIQEDQLLFSHNGDPFTENNLISLVQQVSSKDSENADQEVTGKFGTGFISTHLLSDLIEVAGVLHRDSGKYQRFKISLDRRAEKSEDLSILIKKTIETIRKLDEDPAFTSAEGYEISRKEGNFDTIFSYPLIGESSHDAASDGLEELLNNLPLSLVFLKGIKAVEIDDLPAGVVHKFSCRLEKVIDEVSFYAVTKQSTNEKDEVLHFLKTSSHNSELDLVIPVNNFAELAILTPDDKTPFLYRDFPLIGTERFYFPFYLNGRSFYTTVERDGILLNGDEKKPTHNRALLTIASNKAIQFTKFLLESNAKNLFVCANTRLPLVIGMSDDTKKWFAALQRIWRSELVGLKLVETTKNNISISALKMPVAQFGSTSQDDETIYRFISDIFGEEIVPRSDIRDNWLEVFAPREEYVTWEVKPLCDEETILLTIQTAATLGNFSFKKEDLTTEKQKLEWLNRLYIYLEEKKQLAQLDVFSLTPNELGYFKKNSPLFWEPSSDPIADEILNVLENLDKPWRETMIKRGVIVSNSLKRPRGLVDASKVINDILNLERKEKNLVVADFLDRPNARQVVLEIMSLITENVDKNSFRYLLFKASKELFGFQLDFRLIGHLGNFNFDKATVLLARILHQSIEKCIDLEKLSQALKRSSEAALIWLNAYLRTLAESKGYNYLLEYGNIVPNRKGRLCAFEDLYNFGTAEQPLDNDLLRILKELDPKQDWLPKLAADGISLQFKKTFTIEELTGNIQRFVNEIYVQNAMQTFREQLLDLIDWCNDARHAEVTRKHMGNFDSKKDTIFYALTIKDSVYNKQIVQLMKKPEEIPILVAIASSGIPPAKIKALIDSLKDGPDLDKVVGYVKDLKKQRDDFHFKHQLGKKMEEYFQEALQATHIDADVKYIGSGSHDFVIKSRQTEKEFYIELKSHAKINALEPVSLAISQARLAVHQTQRFALCVVERPTDPILDVGKYMRENLKYLGGLASDFRKIVENADQLDGIINDHSLISLELEGVTYHVKIAMAYVQARAKSFGDLVSKIRQEIA